MKAKNAKVGVRVVIKKGVNTLHYKEGQHGVILEDRQEDHACVEFDHDGDYWWVKFDEMKLESKEK